MIVVTGSAGHLGEALMRRLRKQGQNARGIDIRPSSFTDAVGSITDEDFVRRHLRGAEAVLHAATLHKPHLATHTKDEFIDTNVKGTLVLLEAAVEAGVRAFVFTSTTSAFGSALTPAPGAAAGWINEEVSPIPKNIYGTSKLMAEQLCEMFARRHGVPVVILRTSRFFPEADDASAVRNAYGLDNVQANEFLYRRLDIEDATTAHERALDRAGSLGFAKYVVSATTPFSQHHLSDLRRDLPAVVRVLFPEYEALFRDRGWQMFPAIDRVYVNHRAVDELGWAPRYDFAHVLSCLRAGTDFRSALAREVGSKGYHLEKFADGPYPVEAE